MTTTALPIRPVQPTDGDDNPFKLVARYRKARAIAQVLLANGADAESAAVLGTIEVGRGLAALAASQHVPSEVTWALVVELVKEARP